MSLTAVDVFHQFAGTVRPVLDGVSLTLRPGEMLAVTGPSGSGKSTLLSVLGTLLRPAAGQVCWAGQDLYADRATTRAARTALFSWILQTSNHFAGRSAEDNVAVALLARGWRHAEARLAAGAALAQVGLGHVHGAPARLLSGGEVQRMTLARALVAGRPVVLADEPTGQLDRANTQAVADALRACAQRGAAVLVATHDPRVADSCDRQLALVDGRVLVSR